MCVICDGQTQEQSARFIELTIIHHGWALRHVHPGADDPTGGHWTYTIGLVENFNHPELVITDTEYEVAGSLLNALGEEIRSGHEISPITESGFELNEVHPAHLASELFYGWANNYGYPPGPGEMLQVVKPADRYCTSHAKSRTDLRDPNQFPGGRNPERL
jgi:hypothetical protein